MLNGVVSQVANEVIGEMNLNPDEVFLAQGTLRPDLIESASHLASGKAEVIKTHHNDTELIRKLRDEVLTSQPFTTPLIFLFKPIDFSPVYDASLSLMLTKTVKLRPESVCVNAASLISHTLFCRRIQTCVLM